MKKPYAYYSLAFCASLLIHFSTLEGIFRYAPPLSPPKPVVLPRNQMNMQFMDAYKEKTPPVFPEKTPLIGTDDNLASQPELPDKKVDAKGAPYMKKVSDSKQIKTQSAHADADRMPQVTAVTPPPQADRLDSTDRPEDREKKKNIVKDDILDKKEQMVKKIESQPEQKTFDQSEDRPEKISLKTTVSTTSVPTPPQVVHGGATQNVVQSPLDGKIDELIHQSQTNAESMAELIDALKFNIAKHNLGEYYARMKRKISRNWQTRVMLNYSSELFTSKSFIVFSITEDGDIGYIKIMDSFGNPFFAKDCEAAILESAKFDPLPQEYMENSGKKDLWLFVTFGYNTK